MLLVIEMSKVLLLLFWRRWRWASWNKNIYNILDLGFWRDPMLKKKYQEWTRNIIYLLLVYISLRPTWPAMPMWNLKVECITNTATLPSSFYVTTTSATPNPRQCCCCLSITRSPHNFSTYKIFSSFQHHQHCCCADW